MSERKSRVIFENAHYSACAMRDGSLIVQKRRNGSGVRLLGNQAVQWIDAITTAIDSDEAAALCRAVVNS